MDGGGEQEQPKWTTTESSETAMGNEIEEEAVQIARRRGRHIKKRALKNKALAVSFNEKDLKYYARTKP